MGEMAAWWRGFSGIAGPAAVAALWQGAALAMGLAICLRLSSRMTAADRFRVWLAGFAALAALPFLPALIAAAQSLFAPGGAAAPAVSGLPVHSHVWLLDARWSWAIAALWLAASLARAVDLAVHTVRLRRLWKRAAPMEQRGAGEGARFYQVCATRDLDRPSVIGFFAPRILIPEWLLERLSGEELEQVVLHEAEHLRRRDDWINLAQKLCLLAFPLNPALAWMERKLCREREMACDEGVVRRTRAPRAYAACLASLAERGLENKAMARRVAALSLGAWQRRPELVERVHRILRRRPGLHPAAARALVGVVSCGLALGSVELARCPHLVAFVAPRLAAPHLAANANAVLDGLPMRSFRATDVVAHVGGRAQMAAAQLRRQRIDGRKLRRAAAAAEASREHEAAAVMARAEVPASAAGFSPAPQQWIVLTTWEQVEGVAAENGEAATSPAPQAGAAARATAAPHIFRQYTMTEVIVRVAPAGSEAKSPEAAGKAARAAGMFPMIPLPAAMPIRNGWLVLQL